MGHIKGLLEKALPGVYVYRYSIIFFIVIVIIIFIYFFIRSFFVFIIFLLFIFGHYIYFSIPFHLF